tara:strand:+ start:618 stop:854 length:237 start_codon:yes stop_codon:yes gene_type:complete
MKKLLMRILSLKIGLGKNFPDTSNHSLYRTLFRRDCYPEGNFRENQQLNGSIGLSPLYLLRTIDLHVKTVETFHQSFQ